MLGRAGLVRSAEVISDMDLFCCRQGNIDLDARYLAVLSNLLPAGNRLDYVPRGTMSRSGQLS